jgi:flagellar biosynthesis GTPase FlhF
VAHELTIKQKLELRKQQQAEEAARLAMKAEESFAEQETTPGPSALSIREKLAARNAAKFAAVQTKLTQEKPNEQTKSGKLATNNSVQEKSNEPPKSSKTELPAQLRTPSGESSTGTPTEPVGKQPDPQSPELKSAPVSEPGPASGSVHGQVSPGGAGGNPADSSVLPASPAPFVSYATGGNGGIEAVRAKLLAKKLEREQAGVTPIKVVPVRPSQAVEAAKVAVQAKLTTDKGQTTVELTLPATATQVLSGEYIPARSKHQITIDDLNEDQLTGVKLAEQQQAFCLIGSAGSGKTTTTKLMALALWESGLLGTLPEDTKWLKEGAPAIVFVSFTNQAVYNIREAVPTEFKRNCLTIHKLLEYQPVFFEIDDGEGGMKKTMRYEPQRHFANPIEGIRVCVVEESGNIPVELFDKLAAALPPNTVYIFLGDLNQIPPVFGDAILGFKLLELPVVELKTSYRTDSDSPIKKLALRILEGRPIPDKELLAMAVPGELELVRFKDRVDAEPAIRQMGAHVQDLIRKEQFNPETDVILTPYNVNFGTVELNKYIFQCRAEMLGSPTYEVISGFTKLYFAVGDFVYFEKTKWKLVDIKKNAAYTGKLPQPASLTLNRWGINTDEVAYAKLAAEQTADAMEALFNQLAKTDVSNETALRSASHILVLEDCAGERGNVTVSDVGGVNSIYFAGALTVHKALGSEWRRVICIFHHSQAKMICREILYTAITRAREFLRVYYYGELPGHVNASCFQRGIISQKLPGNNLEAKKEYFRKKLKAQAVKILSAECKAGGKPLDIKALPKDAKELVQYILRNKLAQRDWIEPVGPEEEEADA